MIVPSLLVRQYNRYQPLVNRTATLVKGTLINYCEEFGFAFRSRTKGLTSLAEKIETGELRSWSDIEDLFACTVIIPSLDLEQEVVDFCCRAFSVEKLVRRGTRERDPNSFCFDTTWMKAKLNRPGDLDPQTDLTIYEVPFEIQVATAFEHAWAVATHDLAYKFSDVDWRRYRLASQMKASVEQMDSQVVAFNQLVLSIRESPWPEVQAKQSIVLKVREWFQTGMLPEELVPKDLSRFADNLHRLMQGSNIPPTVTAVLLCLDQHLKAIPSALIPRSISLLQFFTALLLLDEIVVPPFKDYTFHITDELLSLYPALGQVTQRFDYNG